MNDPLVNIDIDVNLFNNIYPDLNGNQSSEYYDCPKFNKLSMNSNTDLLLLNFNIRSIGANLDTFNCFTNLLNKKFDILSFSESWLNDNNKNLYTIGGYEAFHNVRCDGRKGGGLSVYISNVFKSKVIHPCTISLQTIETLFIETVKENCKLLIISIYRPPNANAILFIDKLSELMSIISGNGYDEIILCGDFNLDILNYDNNENTLNLLNHSFR